MAFADAVAAGPGAPGPALAGRTRGLVHALAAAALEVEDLPRAREPSMFEDGTPVGFSWQTGAAGYVRMLVEPGGLALDLPRQIDRSLQVLGRLLAEQGWETCGRDVLDVARGVYPRDPRDLATWWGGMWLGTAAGPDGADLRVYLNLRSGTLAARWQRVVDVLLGRADGDFERCFGQFIDRCVEATAVPVGLGLVLAGGRLRAVRVYQGLERADEVGVAASIPTALRDGAEDAVLAPLRALVADHGRPGAQGVTVAHDFHVEDGVLRSVPRRVKVDVNCRWYVAQDADGFEEWLLGTLDEPDRARLAGFATLLAEHFTGAQLDYCSLGCDTRGVRHRTVYAQPLGLDAGGW